MACVAKIAQRCEGLIVGTWFLGNISPMVAMKGWYPTLYVQ